MKIGFLEGIRFLLDQVKVDIHQLSEFNMRPIDTAAFNDQVQVLKLFVEEYQIDPFNFKSALDHESEKNALDYAILEEKLNAVEYLKKLPGSKTIYLDKKRNLDDDLNEKDLKKIKSIQD